MSIFSKLLGKTEKVETVGNVLRDEDYLELDTNEKTPRSKILVKSYIIREFGDIKDPIDALRDGYTIALINIKPLKDKDLVELKRTVSKLKKVCDAIKINNEEDKKIRVVKSSQAIVKVPTLRMEVKPG